MNYDTAKRIIMQGDWLDFAKTYAQRGWFVGPVKGKEPLAPNGYKDFSDNPGDVERLFEAAGDSATGVGVDLGRSGILAIDIDGLKEDCSYCLNLVDHLSGAVRFSPRGKAFLYRRPDKTPIRRWIKKGKCHHLDILAEGLLVLNGKFESSNWSFDWPESGLPECPESVAKLLAEEVPTLQHPPAEATSKTLALVEQAASEGTDLPWLTLLSVDEGVKHYLRTGDPSRLPAVNDPSESGREFQVMRIVAFALSQIGKSPDEIVHLLMGLVDESPGLERTRGKGSEWAKAEIARVLDKPGLSGEQPIPSELPKYKPKVVPLSSIPRKKVTWLWEPYIPRGGIAFLEGDPGVGKSSLAMLLAAAVTRDGRFPPNYDQPPTAGRVLILNGEDDPSTIIRPRLEEHDADLKAIYLLTGKTEAQPDGTKKLSMIQLADPAFEQAIAEYRPALVIIDPIQAYFGGNVDWHRANETRPLLTQIMEIARKYNVAILAIRHLSKMSGGRAISRGLGSIDLAGAARSILLLSEDPDGDPDTLILAHTKSNSGPKGKSLAFRRTEGRLCYIGVRKESADELLAQHDPGARTVNSLTDEAARLLLQIVEDNGGRIMAKDAERQLKEAFGGKLPGGNTIHKARTRAGIATHKTKEGWVWSSPVEFVMSAEGAEPRTG